MLSACVGMTWRVDSTFPDYIGQRGGATVAKLANAASARIGRRIYASIRFSAKVRLATTVRSINPGSDGVPEAAVGTTLDLCLEWALWEAGVELRKFKMLHQPSGRIVRYVDKLLNYLSGLETLVQLAAGPETTQQLRPISPCEKEDAKRKTFEM
jgi:hypothetical protein